MSACFFYIFISLFASSCFLLFLVLHKLVFLFSLFSISTFTHKKISYSYFDRANGKAHGSSSHCAGQQIYAWSVRSLFCFSILSFSFFLYSSLIDCSERSFQCSISLFTLFFCISVSLSLLRLPVPLFLFLALLKYPITRLYNGDPVYCYVYNFEINFQRSPFYFPFVLHLILILPSVGAKRITPFAAVQ